MILTEEAALKQKLVEIIGVRLMVFDANWYKVVIVFKENGQMIEQILLNGPNSLDERDITLNMVRYFRRHPEIKPLLVALLTLSPLNLITLHNPDHTICTLIGHLTVYFTDGSMGVLCKVRADELELTMIGGQFGGKRRRLTVQEIKAGLAKQHEFGDVGRSEVCEIVYTDKGLGIKSNQVIVQAGKLSNGN